MLSSKSRNARAELATAAALTKRRPRDPSAATRLKNARRDFYAARLEDYIQRTVDEAPDLLPEQRDRLALLIRGGQVERSAAA